MAVALAMREDDLVGPLAPSREEVLARYRRLRMISKDLNSEILQFVSGDAVLRCARRLGIARGRTFILDEVEELNFAYDLAVFTAEPGRSRAIDRYARSVRSAGSDEASVLAAMCRARFSIISIERRHETAGLIAKDLLRGTEHWVVDLGLESSARNGYVMATRLYTPDRFSMAAGVFVPINGPFLEDVLNATPQLARNRTID
jgi:hypothetical protein